MTTELIKRTTIVEMAGASIPTFIEEAVKEVRVIFGWGVLDETHQWTKTYRVAYGRSRDVLRAMDNVFHLLDGQGTVKTTEGPLVDAINACPVDVGEGETVYFRFKCYRNRNLHLEFKRMDLVQKLNAVAGGERLKPGNI